VSSAPTRNRDVLMGSALLFCLVGIAMLGAAAWWAVPAEWKLVQDAMSILKDVCLIILGGYFGAMIAPAAPGVGPIGTSGPVSVHVEEIPRKTP